MGHAISCGTEHSREAPVRNYFPQIAMRDSAQCTLKSKSLRTNWDRLCNAKAELLSFKVKRRADRRKG